MLLTYCRQQGIFKLSRWESTLLKAPFCVISSLCRTETVNLTVSVLHISRHLLIARTHLGELVVPEWPMLYAEFADVYQDTAHSFMLNHETCFPENNKNI